MHRPKRNHGDEVSRPISVSEEHVLLQERLRLQRGGKLDWAMTTQVVDTLRQSQVVSGTDTEDTQIPSYSETRTTWRWSSSFHRGA